ncbi:hypothetical protein L208DRAFT_1266270, partial [Tricholoma matsutake]
LDVCGIEGDIQYGICTEVPEMFQHGGHGGPDSDGFAFFLIMFEPWVAEVNITTINACPDAAADPINLFS